MGGARGGWPSLRTSFHYCAQDALKIFQNLVVPKPEDSESALRKSGVPLAVFYGAFGMLSAIKLDYYALLKADEINNEMAYRLLSPEFYSRELLGSKPSPQYSFCSRRIFS